MKYPYAHNLYYALRNLELALAQEGNLEFLRDYGNGSALTFTTDVKRHIDSIEEKGKDD
ncbi:MAG: hypothetical protein [Bacteriophage sp.]|nr:MAG: hypothetical protein [Bacteriophage sp.]